jgi:hypothetical protein
MTSFVVASGPIRFGSEEQGQTEDVFGAPPPPYRQHDDSTDPWSTPVSVQMPQIVQPSAEARAEPELLEAEANRDASDVGKSEVGKSDPQIFVAIELPTDEQHVEPDDHDQSAANSLKLGTQQHTAAYREPAQDMQREPIPENVGFNDSEEAAEDGLCDAETTLEALPSQEMLSTHTANPTFLNPTFEDVDSIDTDSESDGNDFSLSVNKLSGAVNSTMGRSSGKASASFEAGRRKLEEFKRKKQEAMAKRRFGNNSNGPPHAVVTVKDHHEDNQQQTKSVVSRKVNRAAYTAELEEMASKLLASEKAKENCFQDLDRVLRQLEAVDSERSLLQREKAALVGEIIALKSSLDVQTQEGQVLGQLRRELDSERSTCRELAIELSQLKTEHNETVFELNKAREDVSNAHDNIESLKEMLAESDKERQKLESKLATSTESFGSDELQRRLAKAENAVEKERQAVSMLEKKLKEAESLAEAGRTAVEREMEWQRRCNVAEAELASVQQQQQQKEPHLNQNLQQVANDLRAQCDAAAITISRLMEENQILTDRLNHDHGNQQMVGTSSSLHHQGPESHDSTTMNNLVEEKLSHAENRPRYSWWGWLAGADLAEGNRGIHG